MLTERNFVSLTKMPESIQEQLTNLPCEEERGEICAELAVQLFSLLTSNGIVVENATFRSKESKKIEKKGEIRNSKAPLRDIYGVRFITNEKNRVRVAEIIRSQFPLTPEKFDDGMPSVRDYADPEMKAFVKANFNPRISERHSAMHINIVFQREGAKIYDIAEVQILSEDEMKIFKETREEYENKKSV